MKVKCRNCEFLEVQQEKDGLWFRCGHGFYDTLEGVPVHHGISGILAGNVNIWRAIRRCDYKPVESHIKFSRTGYKKGG